MAIYLTLVGLLHAAFAVLEMFPWSNPVLLKKASSKLPSPMSDTQRELVATIVKNAGIYNAIIAGGFFWSVYRGDVANELAFVLLIGAAVAGAFGTITLKSVPTAVQCAMGVVGAALFWSKVIW